MTAEISPEQIRISLERVLASEQFASSAQLSRFLRYIVDNGQPGGARLLKESFVAAAVFNRGPSYDPKTDPIVRVEARRLRARLDAYYQNGATSDPVRISLPKGGYAPAFEFRETAIPQTSNADPVSGRRVIFPVPAAFLMVVVVVVALAATAGVWYFSWSFSRSPVSRFWTSLFGGERPVLLIPADSGLVMLQNLARLPVSLQDYISGGYRTRLAAHAPFDPETVMNLTARRYTSIADLEFAAGLARRPEAAGLPPRIRYARDVRIEDLRGDSVILLGARQSNPWVGLSESEATFRIDDDERTSALTLVNLKPQPGELPEITLTPEEMRREIYGIVTYHRNRERSGFVLVVAGMSLAGTEAAANFLLDDAKLTPWLQKAESGGRIPEFDLLLRGRNLGGSAPSADVIAFHPKRTL